MNQPQRPKFILRRSLNRLIFQLPFITIDYEHIPTGSVSVFSSFFSIFVFNFVRSINVLYSIIMSVCMFVNLCMCLPCWILHMKISNTHSQKKKKENENINKQKKITHTICNLLWFSHGFNSKIIIAHILCMPSNIARCNRKIYQNFSVHSNC